MTPEQIQEIFTATEIVSATVEDDGVHITYVTNGDVLEKYGSETIQWTLRRALRLGAAAMEGP